MSKNLCIDLNPRKDGEDRTYYVGKLQFPGTIDCSEGVVFLVFVSENGTEQIQISTLDKSDKSGKTKA